MKYVPIAILLCPLFLLVSIRPASSAPPPNVIIFYVDDLGWQDVQIEDVDAPCPYETPNLIKLAKTGMTFTQAYSPAPTCSPSRAGIITGQHPAKIKLTHVDHGKVPTARATERLIAPYLQSHLDLDLMTLADAMKQNGYRTGHVGKWHVGLTAASYGFDFVNQTRGIHRGMDDRTKDFATADDRTYPLSKQKYPPRSSKNPDGISYPFDEVTQSAIEFIDDSKQGPFFLNLCHWMVHWPVLTRNGELLEHYCDKFGFPFPPESGDMTREGQQNPYFAAMTTTVDWSLGRLVEFLQQTDDPRSPGKKLIDTTYIFFTSDNGGAEIRGKEIISDNAPLKYGKKHPEEGGIRVPMVVTGPGIASDSRFEGIVNQLDYFPTILALTQSSISSENFDALSGLDISPVLIGKSQAIRDHAGKERTHLFWHFPHNGPLSMKSAIREGDFKMYKRYDTADYELYRLYRDGQRLDLEEQNDLAKNPEFASVVQRMAATLDAELSANDAEPPYLNPAFQGKTKPSAQITNSSFNASNRRATLAVQESGPAVEHAFVIYAGASAEAPLSQEEQKQKKRLERKMQRTGQASPPVQTNHVAELIGMRLLATIDSDGHSISAVIPEGISAYRFLLVDTNHFLHSSEPLLAK
ncbi:sulfatase [Rhodopirellula sp. SWK7]|uniref:sulfatase n=1 Tax=Rhodopirellula sp. SWK7 TaxID=595460 RepID=UPI0002BF3564|nr:sulfatase [Rhodopirellula sp. SWK7]EMI43680.1 N-acetylgalactosamine 6-sulfate sulfatase (GALNS) [Rhodopirellula sp. SWK7]